MALLLLCLFLLPTAGAFASDNDKAVLKRDLLADPASFRDARFDDFDPTALEFEHIGEATVERSEVSLNYMSFDPLTERPVLPKELSVYDGIYIVQFDSRIYNYMKEDVQARGGVLLQYIPQNAFITRMSVSDAEAVRGLQNVRSVTPFYLYFKIHPELVSMQAGWAAVDFMTWEDGDTGPIVEKVLDVGGGIESADPLMVRAWVTRGQLLTVAEEQNVWYAEAHIEVEFMNNEDSDIIEVRHYPDGAYGSPADGLWSYSGGTGGTFNGLATGKGTIVADVDTGVDGTHNNFGDATDFPAKKVWFKRYTAGSNWVDTNGHGTHTSGTAVGIGKHRGGAFDGLYSGMAPEAGLIGIRMDGNSLYAYMNDPLTHGANISTNSWGATSGHGDYEDTAGGYDILVRDSDLSKPGEQPLITFFSAGNDGATGVTPPATAKNVITVGASGGTAGSAGQVAGFSSTGPTDDGRIKPDVVAPGTSITSSWAGGTDFTDAQGTSMSCPSAAGAGAVIVDYYNRTWHVTPSPSMVKAVMINGATIMGGYAYPGGSQGWGRVNVARSLLEATNKKIFHQDINDSLDLNTGEYVSYPVTVNSAAELRAHLVWMDEAGESGANPALVNDLNMRITDPSGNIYMGNNFQNGLSKTGNTVDHVNNVEGFRLTSPAVGQWKFEPVGENVPEGPQDWSLVISGDITVGQPTFYFQDLAIMNLVLSNETPIEGVPVQVGATIKNVGSLPMTNVNYIMEVDDIILKTDTVLSLAKDEEVGVSTTWIPTRGMHTANVTVDYTDKLIERNERNNTVLLDFMVHNYGLTARLVPQTTEAQPGTNASFKVEVENAGNLIDTYEVVLGPVPDGYSANMSDETALLDQGKKATVDLLVSTPAHALAGAVGKFTIDITSRGNSTYTARLQPQVKIKKVTGFDISAIGNTSVTIDPTKTFDFEFNATNMGNDEEPMSVTIQTTNPSWTGLTNISNTLLRPYSTERFKLSVNPPFQVMGNDYVMLTLDGITGSGLTDSETVTVTAGEIHDLTIAFEQKDTEVSPGGEVRFEMPITNMGNMDETMQLTAQVPEGWDATYDEPTPLVTAYGGTRDYLTILVPKTALAGTYDIVLEAHGDHINSTEVFTVDISQNFGISLSATPMKQFVKQKDTTKFKVTVKNTGNGNDTFKLRATNLPSGLTANLETSEVKLGPGKTKDLNLTVGSGSSLASLYSFTVEATSVGNAALMESISLQVQVTQNTTSGGGGGGNNGGGNNGGGGGGGDDDTPEPTFLQKYGKYLLAGLIGLIILVALLAIALRRRRRKEEPLGPQPAAGAVAGTRSMDELDDLGAKGPEPAPVKPEPVRTEPVRPVEVPAPPAVPLPPKQEMAPIAPPPPPPVKEASPPPPVPEPPAAPSPPAAPAEPAQPPAPPKTEPGKKDEIDDMISNLLGKV